MNNVIIVGGNHHNTLGVIRAFGRSGISPYVIMTSMVSDSFVLRSKYIKKSWVIKSEEVVDFLLKDLRFPEKSVLVGCHDVISSIFDLNYDKLSEYFYVPGAKIAGQISRLAEKKEMSALAVNIGMDVPQYRIINSQNLLSEKEYIQYPCITKPAVSREGSKGDICVCYSEDELTQFFGVRFNRNFMVQTFIDKDFEFQLIGCSLNDGNNIIIPGVSKLIRPSKSSNTGFLKYCQLDDSFEKTLSKSKKFIRATGYNGLFSMEFLRDKNGTDYFMEINFRNDGNTICVTNSGVNLPMIWYNHCNRYELGNTQNIHIEYVMPEFQELTLWYSGDISLFTMLNDFRKATSYMDYDQDDLLPTKGWRVFRKQLIHCLCFKPIKKLLG